VPRLARVTINEEALRSALAGPEGMVTQYVMRLTRQIRNKAVLYCPVDTGNLRSSIVTAVQQDGMQVVGIVGTPVDYAVPVHEGYVIRRKDGGITQVRGRPFLRRAMEEVTAGLG
jgi:hypothetical protein